MTDEVAEAEADDFLRVFSHRQVLSSEARQWLRQWLKQEEGTMQSIKEMEGYDEMLQKLLDSLPPEQRLAGLPPEQQPLALSDEVLRRFPDEYLLSLPTEVQDAIRRRIGRPSR